MRVNGTVSVWIVLYDGPGDGPAGDGTHTARFGRFTAADAFACARLCYGMPATVDKHYVPRALAKRWGVAP